MAITYTAATRTVAGAPASTFQASDQTYQRQVVMKEGSSVYWGRVATFVSGTEAVLLNWGSLPVGDVADVDVVFVLPLSEEHSYLDYVNGVKAFLNPYDSAKLSDDELKKMLARAVTVSVGGQDLPEAQVETVWADPETRNELTHVQTIGVKVMQLGVSQAQAWREAGYGPSDIERILQDKQDEKVADANLGAAIVRGFNAGQL